MLVSYLVNVVISQSFQINRYRLVVTHPAVVLYRWYNATSCDRGAILLNHNIPL